MLSTLFFFPTGGIDDCSITLISVLLLRCSYCRGDKVVRPPVLLHKLSSDSDLWGHSSHTLPSKHVAFLFH